VDSKGLVVGSRNDLADFKLPYAHDHAPVPNLAEAVEAIRPTALIGVSTIAKAFDRETIEAMARFNERPVIFPFSNPTSRAACAGEEPAAWTKARALLASGSPFDPVTLDGKTFIPGQGNNVYIFP